MKKIFYSLIALLCSGIMATMVSCIDDAVSQESYYTFTGEMVTDYLTNREKKDPGSFSDFIEVLHRAQLWDLLSTYGTYTCFAPTNQAIQQYLRDRGHASVEELTKTECDTLAWMHLLKVAYYTTDISGSLPTSNMNNRFLTLTCDTIAGNVAYHINGSEMITRDDSVVNGVVHQINQVITVSDSLLGSLICIDPNLTIFGQALKLTGLADTIDSRVEDESYVIDLDSTVTVKNRTKHFGNQDFHFRFPAKREFKYSVFAVPDSIFKKKKVNNLQDLIARAKRIYDNTYPDDAGKYDNDFTHRKNPLNRYIAYHILDRWTTYSELTISEAGFDGRARSQFRTDVQDMNEFYETMAPYTILKVSEGNSQKYINRKGLGEGCGATSVQVRGARIFTPDEAKTFYNGYSDAINGIYYYVDGLIEYDKETTINKVLNCRMRIDATTLSPDFMTASGRNCIPNSDDKKVGVSYLLIGFRSGDTKNFIFGEDTFFGIAQRYWCNSYEDDMCACLDNFDITFKLPPVPAGQTYEVRLGYQAGTDRTVVQIYFNDNLKGDIPCGIPVDLRKFGAEYGYLYDEQDLENDSTLIEANDKSMRNQGYMKGPSGFMHPDCKTTMRNNAYKQCLRRILTTKYFEEGHDYYIRLRQVLDNKAEMSLDYIELVPKSIYNGEQAEDRY